MLTTKTDTTFGDPLAMITQLYPGAPRPPSKTIGCRAGCVERLRAVAGGWSVVIPEDEVDRCGGVLCSAYVRQVGPGQVRAALEDALRSEGVRPIESADDLVFEGVFESDEELEELCGSARGHHLTVQPVVLDTDVVSLSRAAGHRRDHPAYSKRRASIGRNRAARCAG